MSSVNPNPLAVHFQYIQMSSPEWPVRVGAVTATEQTFDKWPNFPRAATPDCGRMGHGRGLNQEDCSASALGEMIEIASCSAWGDEDLTTATLVELGENVWTPSNLSGFSNNQIIHASEWNVRLGGLDYIPKPLSQFEPIEWVLADSLTDDRQIWVAIDSVLIGRSEKKAAVAIADTNGCACGRTKDEALLSALYELIERDATGRWWYGGRSRPRIDLESVVSGPNIAKHIDARGRTLYIFDITTDIAVPTVAAISCNQSGRAIAAGFATRASIHDAAQSALTELMQMELRIEVSHSHPEVAGDLAEWIGNMTLQKAAPFVLDELGVYSHEDRSVVGDVEYCLQQFEMCECEVAMIDMTRQEFGVPVIRVVSPDLCHWKPRFGRDRLLAPDDNDTGRNPKYTKSPNPVLLMV